MGSKLVHILSFMLSNIAVSLKSEVFVLFLQMFNDLKNSLELYFMARINVNNVPIYFYCNCKSQKVT